jgi:D-alanyl-D-alanine carboxypeptidase (penicillin-binding protein 5/6)
LGAAAGLVLVLLVTAVIVRIATERVPPLALHRTLAAYVHSPGAPPALAWPADGQAAVEVEGLGSLGASGDSVPTPIASVAKVMTAYLTLLEHPLGADEPGFVMTISSADVAEQLQRAALGQSTVPVRAGERITERQALQALLLPSANNIAVLLAVHDAGGRGAFVARMNSAARELGMSSTTYTDPSGFDASTVSTATDQLKLARVAMQLPAFAAIVEERAAELPVVGRVVNINSLVGREGYVGVKTGSDGRAGGCLVFAKRVAISGRRLTVLGVVLGQRAGPPINAALTSAQRLANSAADALGVETVLPAGTSVLSASSADGGRTTVTTAGALREVAWPGLALHVEVVVRPSVTRLRAGERIATVAVGGAGAAMTGALAMRSLGAPSLGWRLQHLL